MILLDSLLLALYWQITLTHDQTPGGLPDFIRQA